jgi:hypothetical protein
MWNLVGRMDCIDIGHDYYLIKFECQADLNNVLKGGPKICWATFSCYSPIGTRF